jgi:hypothetical protein
MMYPTMEALQRGASTCPHGRDYWQYDDCMQCGCEIRYCPRCPFFRCPACTQILLRPMPCEETYPFFPPGHLSDQQCWEIWMSYTAVSADDIQASERLPLATQQRLWPFQLRCILLWFHRFGFSVTHVKDLTHFIDKAKAQEASRTQTPPC